MAATGVASTSSSFATLLKQSKFASYSPAIAQVYTTYGGHAFRGDWGLKRPLSVRKSGHALLVHSIDSPQQQTEFRSGEPETRMVKRWNETGVNVTASEAGDVRLWSVQYSNRSSRGGIAIDSEFCTYNVKPDLNAGPAGRNLALGVRTPPSIEATPNFNTMSQKEFNRYLEKIRKLRPAFREFIEEKENQYRSQTRVENVEGETEKTMLFYKRKKDNSDDMASHFLKEMAYQLHGDPNSQVLEPYPHRNGGLFYPVHNTFQTGLLYDSIKSHVSSFPARQGLFSSSAGMIVHLSAYHSEDVSPVDWSRQDLKSGNAPIRVFKAELVNPPEVVTTLRSPPSKLSYSAPAASILRKKNVDITTPPFTYPAGLKSMTMNVEGTTVKGDLRTNKWRPGSFGYSLEAPDRTIVNSGPQAPPPPRVAVNLSGAGPRRHQIIDKRVQQNLTSLLDRMPSRQRDGKTQSRVSDDPFDPTS